MKANNGSGNTIDRDEWQTPQWLFDKLNEQYDFEYDCCAGEDNAKTILYSTSDFLDVTICNYRCWMNPPFSKAKEILKHFFNVVECGVAIYRCDNMEWSMWQEIIFKKASWIFIPKGRIHYEGINGKGCRFPSALIGFNVDPPKGLTGTTLFLKSKEVSS